MGAGKISWFVGTRSVPARELRKPCIIGTKAATRLLRDGDLIEVDADQGLVRVLTRTKKGA